MNDTSAEVAQLYRSLLMAKSGEERLVMGARMFDAARAIVLASFPPDLSANEMRQRLFARLYPDMPAERVPAELRSALPL